MQTENWKEADLSRDGWGISEEGGHHQYSVGPETSCDVLWTVAPKKKKWSVIDDWLTGDMSNWNII